MATARTLLLIDDDAVTREVLSLLLSNEGWIVTAAAEGMEALAILRATDPPAVILSDLQMPGLSGTALAAAIRAAAPMPFLLAMTATPQTTPPQGFDAILIKPFPPEAIEHHYNALKLGNSHQAVSEVPAAQDTSSVLDPTILEQLARTMSPARLHALLAFVADDADTRIHRMDTAAQADDDVTFRAEAHALKGSCGMVGAHRLKALASLAENVGIPEGTLTKWKHADFVSGIEEFRLMLKTLPRGVT